MNKNIFHASFLGTMNFFYLIQRFKLESLDPGAESIDSLELETNKGMLVTVKLQSESKNLDMYLLPYRNVENNSFLVIYKKLGINLISIDSGLNEFWSKYSQLDNGNSATSKATDIFIKLLNKDTIPTGDIYLEVVYQMFK